MHFEGDGEQVLELFKSPVEKVLRELMADMRLAGCQHFLLHEYKDQQQQTFCNGSVTFHLARLKVGEGKAAVSIVRYICWHLSQERDSNSTCFKFIYILRDL
jgi:hypothetical protein